MEGGNMARADMKLCCVGIKHGAGDHKNGLYRTEKRPIVIWITMVLTMVI
jgi:hypothetical protein